MALPDLTDAELQTVARRLGIPVPQFEMQGWDRDECVKAVRVELARIESLRRVARRMQ